MLSLLLRLENHTALTKRVIVIMKMRKISKACQMAASGRVKETIQLKTKDFSIPGSPANLISSHSLRRNRREGVP